MENSSHLSQLHNIGQNFNTFPAFYGGSSEPYQQFGGRSRTLTFKTVWSWEALSASPNLIVLLCLPRNELTYANHLLRPE